MLVIISKINIEKENINNILNRLTLIKQRQVYLKATNIFNMYRDLPINSVSLNEIIRKLSSKGYLSCNKRYYKTTIIDAGTFAGWEYRKFGNGIFFR